MFVNSTFEMSTRQKNRRRGGRRRTNRKAGKLHNDQIVLKGTLSLPVVTAAAGNGVINALTNLVIAPTTLGARPLIVAGIYSRWKVNSLTLRYIPAVGSTTAGALAIGVLDDDNLAAETTGLTTYVATVQLRTALETQVWQKSSLRWTPVDPTRWFYIDTESAAPDERLLVPGTIFGNGTGVSALTTYGTLMVDYILSFKGATEPYTPS